jgi:short chain dehydrogenase
VAAQQIFVERKRAVGNGGLQHGRTRPTDELGANNGIAASKSALASLNDAMRTEFAPFGIRVLLVEPGAMRTGIFTTARKFRDDMLSANFQAEQRYRAALTAMDEAFEKAGADESEVTVRAIMQALTARTPKVRVVVGRGTGPAAVAGETPGPFARSSRQECAWPWQRLAPIVTVRWRLDDGSIASLARSKAQADTGRRF